jgi:hypothetical protein
LTLLSFFEKYNYNSAYHHRNKGTQHFRRIAVEAGQKIHDQIADHSSKTSGGYVFDHLARPVDYLLWTARRNGETVDPAAESCQQGVRLFWFRKLTFEYKLLGFALETMGSRSPVCPL